LKFDNDAILYNKAQRVLSDIEHWTAKLDRTATEYSGVDEFYLHLKEYLSHYAVEKNAIVHVNQRVSCALVQAIQLIACAPLSEQNTTKLEECIQTISKHGEKEQRIMLAKALHKTHNDIPQFHSPIMDNFVSAHCNSMTDCKEPC
jgi:hypothetical protein